MLQFQLRRLLRGRVFPARSLAPGVFKPSSGSSASKTTEGHGTPAAVTFAAAVSSAPGTPSPGDLPDIRSVPGTSSYGSFHYDAASDTPYPIWMLDPEGGFYKTVLWVARNSSALLESLHDASHLPW